VGNVETISPVPLETLEPQPGPSPSLALAVPARCPRSLPRAAAAADICGACGASITDEETFHIDNLRHVDRHSLPWVYPTLRPLPRDQTADWGGLGP
jgi:hypothetical protein